MPLVNRATPPDYQAGERRLHYQPAGFTHSACHVHTGRLDLTADPAAVTCLKCKVTLHWRRAHAAHIEDDAARAYDAAALAAWGEYARLNFPGGQS
jgi:hypothetical protein